jgi:hypothetical protein
VYLVDILVAAGKAKGSSHLIELERLLRKLFKHHFRIFYHFIVMFERVILKLDQLVLAHVKFNLLLQ